MDTLATWSRKRNWGLSIALAIGAILFSVYHVVVAMPTRETRAVVDAYKSLEIGVSREVLDNHFLRGPDLVCTFERAEVLYYHADARAHYITGFGENQRQEIVELRRQGTVSAGDLPFLYGYVQVLVDRGKNVVVAKTWIGETSTIDTALGQYPGSTVNELPEEIKTDFGLDNNSTGRVD